MENKNTIRNNSRFRRAALSSLSSALLQVVSMVCAFVMPGLILSYYGSAYNGVISSITQFLGFFSILQAGIQGATRVALYKTFANKDIEGTSGIINANTAYYKKISYFLIGYIIFLAILFPLIIHDDVSKLDIVLLVLIIGAGNFIYYLIGYVYKALLSADQAIYIIDFIQIISLVASTAIMALLIVLNESVVIAKAAGTLVSSLNPLLLFLFVRKKYKIDKTIPPNREALRERWQVLANSIANIVHENVDITFITFFCSALEVSVYAIYNLVSNGLIRFVTVLTNGMESAFGDMWAKGELEILKKNFRRYEFFLFITAGILSSCMIVLILPFIKLFTSGIDDVNYIRPVFALILSLVVATMCIRAPYITLVQGAGKYRETKVGSIIEAGLNIVLTLIFVNIMGISGAVLGTVIANIFRTIQYGHFSYNHLLNLPFILFLKKILWLSLSGVVSALLASIPVQLIVADSWIKWLLSSVLCLIVVVIVFSISSLLFYKKDFFQTIDFFKARLKK